MLAAKSTWRRLSLGDGVGGDGGDGIGGEGRVVTLGPGW